MMKNRSVPADIILPHVFYEDVAAASAWLQRCFGFTEHFRFAFPDGTVHGAMMYRGDAWVMLKSPGTSATSPSKLGGMSQVVMIFVEDLESHFETAQSENVSIVEPLNITEYGEQHYAAVDLEGHQWIFARHVRDVFPEDWGATMS